MFPQHKSKFEYAIVEDIRGIQSGDSGVILRPISDLILSSILTGGIRESLRSEKRLGSRSST